MKEILPTPPSDLNTIFAAPGKVRYLSEIRTNTFESSYLNLRQAEGRLYTDQLVAELPYLPRAHPLHAEWQMRVYIFRRLHTYVARKATPLTIFDLGCGNGWMSNALAQPPGCRVCGIDLNSLELEQAARVFAANSQLSFVYGNIFDDILPAASADIILMASSLQYFPDIAALMKRLFSLLKGSGEIHILESPFYDNKEIEAAKQRTSEYYQQLGFPEMAAAYHHHTLDAIKGFDIEFMYTPDTLIARICRRLLNRPVSPFRWIKISRAAG